MDFVCFERRLIVEVDGAHHYERPEDDAVRTAGVHSQGFKLMRFSNREMLTELESVKDAVWRALEGDGAGRPSP